MKIAYYRFQSKEGYGVVRNNLIHPIEGSIYGDYKITSVEIPLDEVELLPPVQPRKLLCIGLNYALHAKESNMDIPTEPMLFMCSPNAIIGPNEAIKLNSYQDRIDYEAELAVIIGKKGKNIPASQYKDYILGYTCGNDVSNRDLQKKDGQFTRAKSFDTYKPLGPYIETDLDPNNLEIKLWQNEELKLSSNTNDMIFSVAQIVEFLSHIMTLEEGDVILTGTPSGIGSMKSGDSIKIQIENIGEIVNSVE